MKRFKQYTKKYLFLFILFSCSLLACNTMNEKSADDLMAGLKLKAKVFSGKGSAESAASFASDKGPQKLASITQSGVANNCGGMYGTCATYTVFYWE